MLYHDYFPSTIIYASAEGNLIVEINGYQQKANVEDLEEIRSQIDHLIEEAQQ